MCKLAFSPKIVLPPFLYVVCGAIWKCSRHCCQELSHPKGGDPVSEYDFWGACNTTLLLTNCPSLLLSILWLLAENVFLKSSSIEAWTDGQCRQRCTVEGRNFTYLLRIWSRNLKLPELAFQRKNERRCDAFPLTFELEGMTSLSYPPIRGGDFVVAAATAMKEMTSLLT